ncbi:hypothetical protein [Streptomyces sp. NBC_00158]|uniref:hypothetical protein n=1 Tax=Streptomyces sp. NBC_00158 TaxID=2903627 RepID=UPI00324E2594
MTGASGCRSGNGCWLELWDAPNTSGFHQEYRQSTSYVGDALNDRASSIALL